MPVSRHQVLVLILLTLLPLALSTSLHPRDDDDNEPGLHGNPSLRTAAHIAHGVTISTAIILFFPVGGLSLRLMQLHPPPSLNPINFHIIWQLTGLFILVTGFALGCWLSYLHNELWDYGHEQMGTVVCGLFLLQPVLGLLGHRRNVALSSSSSASEKVSVSEEVRSTWIARIHVWYGRSLLVLGAVCGGTGIQLAANWTVPQMLVYVVVALVVAGVYVVVLWVWWGRGRGSRRLRLGMRSLETLPLGLPGEKLDLPRGMFGGSGSERGSEEIVGGVVEEERGK